MRISPLDLIKQVLQRVRRFWRARKFPGSARYWDKRYGAGGGSGAGSVGQLGAYKAEIVNELILRNGVGSVIEFGCGDGQQLQLLRCPEYIGLDVSVIALRQCMWRHGGDNQKSFFHYDPRVHWDPLQVLSAEMSLSMDVIYHLVEDDVYRLYMEHLFNAGRRVVVIYSSNEEGVESLPHVRHRRFTDWVERFRPGWALTERVPNRFPHSEERPKTTSRAEFYVFEPGSG